MGWSSLFGIVASRRLYYIRATIEFILHTLVRPGAPGCPGVPTWRSQGCSSTSQEVENNRDYRHN